MIHITKKDNFVWLDLANRMRRMDDIELQELWMGLELYAVHEDDSESLLESVEEIREAIDLGLKVCVEVGHIPKINPQLSWWGKSAKILRDGYWYIKYNDIKSFV